uniref:Uncharacterized protein n=1 Tax=Brassica oleracea TaxID=3712 RepID=A0A3P6E8U1_BRAOL|nr:unnamed protein product [Brassica oleracea]
MQQVSLSRSNSQELMRPSRTREQLVLNQWQLRKKK